MAANLKDVFAWKRGATPAEALGLLKANKAIHAKDVGKNVLKVFLEGDRSFYVKGTVKVRAALSEFI